MEPGGKNTKEKGLIFEKGLFL